MYGTANYDPERNAWRIDCEPHVALRLKRIFPKIHQWARGTLALTATTQDCLDLEWFLQRYPLSVDQPDLLRSRASAHREQVSLVSRFLENQSSPMDFPLAIPLREYQRVAASVAVMAGQLLLADDVGLGKTAVAIGALSSSGGLPAIVVTLTHLPIQWESELKKFAPQLRVHRIRKGQPYDLTLSRGKRVPFPDVLLTNYHKLSGWADTLAPITKSVIFDECQELRHSGSLKYGGAKRIAESAKIRMGLSATPIYNYGGEIFNVISVLAPDALGTHDEFVTEWCTSSIERDKERIKDPRAFGAHLRDSGLMLRRTRKDVGRELPPVIVVPHSIEADAHQLDKLSAGCAELAQIILAQKEDYRGQKMMASEEFSNVLRQATGISKAPYVAEFVRMLIDAGQRVVLYGWHREVYSIWNDRLRDLKPAMYTGSESASRKEESKRRFIGGDAKVLIISLRAGMGLDGLQGVASTVVFGELDWSPGVHEQCIGRVHRDGQDDYVTAYYLISDSGSDPVVADVLGVKKSQIDGLRDPSIGLVERLEIDPNHVRKLAEHYTARHASRKSQSVMAEDAHAARIANKQAIEGGE